MPGSGKLSELKGTDSVPHQPAQQEGRSGARGRARRVLHSGRAARFWRPDVVNKFRSHF